MKSGNNWLPVLTEGKGEVPAAPSSSSACTAAILAAGKTLYKCSVSQPEQKPGVPALLWFSHTPKHVFYGGGETGHMHVQFVQTKGPDFVPDLFTCANKFVPASHIHRLSDPDQSNAVADLITELGKNKESALEFLKNIGVVTSEGRLAKAFGG